MQLSTLLSLALAAVAAASDSYCTSSPYNIIQPYAKYQPAKDYCSGAYPVHGTTHTSWHKTTKTWWHTWTHTATETTTAPATTTTVTTTTTTISKKNRREAKSSAGGWASCSSKLKGDGKMGPACSCIETTPTATTTMSTTVSTTVSTTTTTTETETEIPTSTITITSTAV